MTRATLDKDPHDVARMFDAVARRYDLTNSVLSFGQDRRWRHKAREALRLQVGQRVLDVAAGTGVSTLELHRTGAYAVAADFSLGMLRAGRRKADRARFPFVAADAMRLPFGDCVFDAVTISFGLRNISDVAAALSEFSRVTKPGGRLVVCEFSQPTTPVLKHVYLNHLLGAVPRVARRVSSNPDAYCYLAESIRSWPEQSELARTISANGWTDVSWRNLTWGVVALHRATRQATP
jgi:demethylmenaquinone methyltransferase / 2-methoxy-6-polyprenyl-1,4-benzoquinol methylase